MIMSLSHRPDGISSWLGIGRSLYFGEKHDVGSRCQFKLIIMSSDLADEFADLHYDDFDSPAACD